MKRTLFIGLFMSLLSLHVLAHTYVSSSVLASGNIVKIQVPQTGIYCLTYEQLEAWGINPGKVRVMGYGGNLINQDFRQTRDDDVPSIPFYMEKGTDGVFSAGDYILFYAQGPVGWQWNGSTFKRTRNHYANYGCYFLSDNAGEQRLMAMTDTLQAGTCFDAYTYTALQLHELDQVNLIDVTGTSGGGREWYGESLAMGESISLPFDFDDVVTTQQMRCRVAAAASAGESTRLKVQVADTSKACTFSSKSDHIPATTNEVTILTHPTGNSLPVTLTYSATQNSAKFYLNTIEMLVPCSLRLRDNTLFIRNLDHIGQTQLTRYHLLGAKRNTQIWNLTNPTQAYIANTSWQGDTLCWLGSNDKPQLFVAIQPSTSFATPATRGKVYNQNIHQQLRGVQHVIVTPEAFRSAAEQLRQVHEQHNPKERWLVVSDEEVYNEFSSGTPDASAIRWMMKYLWDIAEETGVTPQDVLLFGDGSFDNRQILSTSGTPYMITYQAVNSTNEPKAYAADDYFGWLLDNAGIRGNNWDDTQATMQISVGRLPVSSNEQGEQMVNKIATYLLNANTGSWKQQLCFLADDGDVGNGGVHVRSVELAAKAVREQSPEYIIHKIYLDAYEQETSASGESYPLAYSTYTNLLNSGVMLMDYAGHGSPNNICSEMFLTRKQVEAMTNTNLGIWALATCNFARFDQRDISTAEVAILNPNGGAIGVVSSDRTAYVSPNETLNKYFCTNLVTHLADGTYPYTIGEALRLAKNKMSGVEGKLPYVLLGDPSVKLNYAAPYQLTVTSIPDTIHALDLVTIAGYVTTGVNDTVAFDGQLTIKVFDKQQTLVTRDNDQPSAAAKSVVYYQDFPNQLFIGQCAVENGKFTLQFRMPKDLRYNIDYARLTLYATGLVNNEAAEAMGYSEAFKVGGSSPIVIEDNEGPEMNLYLNSPFFRDGEEVNPTPHFYANLKDQNGINTAGSGIGHDLQLIIDNDAKQTYVLNAYYQSTSGSYQEGTVSYPLSTLSDGQHTLSFRAWDMLNNATTKSLGFTVNSNQGPSLKRLWVYPNPVSHTGELTMQMQYDRPDDLVSIELTFYDLMGHTIWSTTRQLYGYNGEAIFTLDMAQTNLPTGIYIYQFRIQTTTQSSNRYSGRVIVY